MPELRIRVARIGDAPAIFAVLDAAFSPFRQCYPEAAYDATAVPLPVMEARIRSKDETVLVVTEGDEVVGTVSLKIIDGRDLHFYTMGVSPSQQGKGVGRLLFEAIEEQARRSGCRRMTLETSAPLSRAIHAYEKHGFKRTGKVRPYHGTEVFEMAKEIS